MKSWTYAEITEVTEKRIAELMGNPDWEPKLRRDWAYGVYIGWYELTMGRQNDGDAERMEKLALGEKS